MGARVIITARNEQRLNETLAQMEGDGHQMIKADLSSNEELDSLVAQLPVLDGLVNNAGFTKMRPILQINELVFKDIMQVNTFAPIMLTQKILKKKKLRNGGSIVFTSSTASMRAGNANSMYACSKAAISIFARNAAKEFAPKLIRVNTVCPSMVETAIMTSDNMMSEEQIAASKASYPLGRWGKPEEVAWAIIYFLSDASQWVSGTNIILDGGRSA
jgi:NAD(P)-dependent dehydrogenase (short-subunit alcohol dehydrogenase family)